jgi:hypothetical protein
MVSVPPPPVSECQVTVYITGLSAFQTSPDPAHLPPRILLNFLGKFNVSFITFSSLYSGWGGDTEIMFQPRIINTRKHVNIKIMALKGAQA